MVDSLRRHYNEQMAAQVRMYSTKVCPYCVRAKALLDRKRVSYTDTDVMKHPDKREEMTKRAQGRTSVPQIFIDGRHIGGCDDLHALEAKGELNALLEL